MSPKSVPGFACNAIGGVQSQCTDPRCPGDRLFILGYHTRHLGGGRGVTPRRGRWWVIRFPPRNGRNSASCHPIWLKPVPNWDNFRRLIDLAWFQGRFINKKLRKFRFSLGVPLGGSSGRSPGGSPGGPPGYPPRVTPKMKNMRV